MTFSHLLRCFFALMICCASLHAVYAQPQKKWGITTPIQKAPIAKQPLAENFLLKPGTKPLIIVDPGHGGKDRGTYSRNPPKYQEKFLTLSVANMLRVYLEKLGFAVLMTRTEDIFVSLDDRASYANGQNPKAFISIHFNSAPNKQAEGIEIFYYRTEKNKTRSDASKNLADYILKRTLETTGAKSRGVKHGNLAVIRETKMPAVLIEGGFLSNDDERLKLKDAVYLKKLAWGIAQGIQDHLK